MDLDRFFNPRRSRIRRLRQLMDERGVDSTWFGPTDTTKLPLIQIHEAHHPTEKSTGLGVRRCGRCDKRWISVLGSYLDGSPLAKLKVGRDYRVYASWPETIGLTCRRCHRSLCMEHVGKPEQTGPVPQAHEYSCPFCSNPMDMA
ncbi:MAG: hypothetical protein J2P24_13385 [Streptosporangiales bacterium]|nr:hypothetical protein [Streptosporangiales bacterium]